MNFLIQENKWKDFSEKPDSKLTSIIWIRNKDYSINLIEVKENPKDNTLNDYFLVIYDCGKKKMMAVTEKKLDPIFFLSWQPTQVAELI